MTRHNRSWLAALAVVLLACAAWAERTQLKPGFNLFSKSQEVQLGRQAQAQAEQQLDLVRDTTLNNYINTLGQRLARFSPAQDYTYSFHVVRDKRINAFALPGGPVYVNTGTIAACQNEDQLAGVIGHEMTHIAMRHATNQASKRMALETPLAIAGGMAGGAAGSLAQLGIGFGANLVTLKYSRSAEEQADLGGTHMMYDAGYDPDQLARFFQIIESESGSRSAQFLSDHPNPGNRVQLIHNEEQRMDITHHAAQDPPEFEQAKAIAVRLNNEAGSQGNPGSPGQPRGTRRGRQSQQSPPNEESQPSQPGMENQPDQPSQASQPSQPSQPSGRFMVFDGGSFRISYPDNWTLYGKETSALTIAPPDGMVQGPDGGGLAYGAMLSSFEPEEASARSNPSAAVSALLAQMRQANPNLRITGQNQSVTVAGRKATSVTMTNRSPIAGQTEFDWLVAVPQADGTLWYVVFVSPQSEYDKLRSTFQQMLNSVKFTA